MNAQLNADTLADNTYFLGVTNVLWIKRPGFAYRVTKEAKVPASTVLLGRVNLTNEEIRHFIQYEISLRS